VLFRSVNLEQVHDQPIPQKHYRDERPATTSCVQDRARAERELSRGKIKLHLSR